MKIIGFYLLVCFLLPLSYAESKNSISEHQLSEQQISESPSQEILENNFPDQAKASVLSVKGEVGTLFLDTLVASVLMEFHTPVYNENKQLKWLAQAGVGGITSGDMDSLLSYFSFDTGLRYDFPFSTTVSLKGGVALPLADPTAIVWKGILSVGQKITNIHLALNAGISALSPIGTHVPLPVFLSLSASIPLKKW